MSEKDIVEMIAENQKRIVILLEKQNERLDRVEGLKDLIYKIIFPLILLLLGFFLKEALITAKIIAVGG